MRQITKMLSLGSAVAYLLSGCGHGSHTTPNADNPSSTSLNLTMSAPAEYPAGIAVNMPVVVTNTNNYTLTNINYTIVDDNATNGQITIDPTSATNCATIAANQPCTLSALIPATSKPGGFSIQASASVASNSQPKQSLLSSVLQSTTAATTITTTGLTQVPINNATGVNGLVIYSPSSVTLPNDNSGIALVTFVVNSANAGLFNTVDLVDSNGNSLQYQVLTGNSGNGMTALSQGSVVTLAVSIPSGATQLSLFPSLKYNGTPIANGLASSPTIINILRPDSPAQGILNIIPSNFSLNESSSSQVITVTNSGNGAASSLSPSVPAPMQIDTALSTCGTTLESNAVCTYVVKFDGQSDKAGTSAFTLNYNTGTQPSSNTATFTYRGAKAVASLNISSGTNPNFNFSTTTTNSSESSIVTLTNSGITPLSNLSYELPSGGIFTTSTVGVSNPCTTSLAVGATCNIALIYNNSTVTPNTTNNVIVKYKYQDPIDSSLQLDGSSTVAISYKTNQSQAILSTSASTLNFGNVFNNNDDSTTQSITITNTGEIATVGTPTVSFESAVGIYSIASSTCTSTLNAGESCVITVTSGPVASSYNAGSITNKLNISYTPYPNAITNTVSSNLTTQVVTAQSAIITVTQTATTGFSGGNGESSGSPFMSQNNTPATVTYTITNTGKVPATNFGFRTPSIGSWIVVNSTCEDTLESVGSANNSCTVKFSKKIDSNTGFIYDANLLVNNITLGWFDQDSPNGERQPFATSPVYVQLFAPANITINPTAISMLPGESATVTATLSGGYNVQNQTVSIENTLPTTISSITSSPSPCVLNMESTSCTFTITATSNAVNPTDGTTLNVYNSGVVPLNSSEISVSILSFQPFLYIPTSQFVFSHGLESVNGALVNPPSAQYAAPNNSTVFEITALGESSVAYNYSQNVLYKCNINTTDASLSDCVISSDQISGILNMSITTVGSNKFAYMMIGSSPNIDLYECSIDSDGYISAQSCVKQTESSIPFLNSNPNLVITNIGNSQVMYINNGVDNIYLCTIDSPSGSISNCQVQNTGITSLLSSSIINTSVSKFLYISNLNRETYKCDINSTSGNVSNCTKQTALDNLLIKQLAGQTFVSNTFAYVLGSNNIYKCDVNNADGSLSNCLLQSTYIAPYYTKYGISILN